MWEAAKAWSALRMLPAVPSQADLLAAMRRQLLQYEQLLRAERLPPKLPGYDTLIRCMFRVFSSPKAAIRSRDLLRCEQAPIIETATHPRQHNAVSSIIMGLLERFGEVYHTADRSLFDVGGLSAD